ncbi:uncharacterized protein CLUP02_01790 [Colletotrichum lupini]|uniref:Uncharacterized protein n=1 Tax=Colletotrichum lupini TaxID=145971 RepID=A0A9Q8SEP8_9PEZI|nr:uncharacterized protein CLUP02_01790 [Colletotrichum lupini]UQC75137.1 hypothetical protein CLUP02_01790 [Colletotrichum lupini]
MHQSPFAKMDRKEPPQVPTFICQRICSSEELSKCGLAVMITGFNEDAVVFAATGYIIGAFAFPADRPLVKMEVANTAVTVADEVDKLNSSTSRLPFSISVSKATIRLPPSDPTTSWTTDNLGQFRGRVRLRLNPLFHILGEEFRWTFSWRRGGTEGCVRDGTMSVREHSVDFSFNIDSTMEYFFTIARV